MDKLIMLKSAWLAPDRAALQKCIGPYVHSCHGTNFIINTKSKGLNAGPKTKVYLKNILINTTVSYSCRIQCVPSPAFSSSKEIVFMEI